MFCNKVYIELALYKMLRIVAVRILLVCSIGNELDDDDDDDDGWNLLIQYSRQLLITLGVKPSLPR
jgi:hypothetical protein